MKLLEPVFNLLRHCAVCGASFRPVVWLCPQCAGEFYGRIRKHQRSINRSIEHHYLLDWSPHDLFLNQIVYSLKGNGLQSTYDGLGDWIFQQINSNPKKRIFYPSKGKRDHAQILAESLARKLDWEVQPILKKTGFKQASLTRLDRARLQMIPVGKWENAIVVDDIVTTGATMKACYEALGCPKKLTVWSLFYRKLL